MVDLTTGYKHLHVYHYPYKSSPFQLWWKDLYIVSRQNEDEIMDIFHECVNSGCDLGTLKAIKEKYRKRGRTHTKYVSKRKDNVYQVCINGVYMGRYNSLNDAKKWRDKILESGKTPSHINRYNKELLSTTRRVDKYIYCTPHGTFRIQRFGESWGTFSSLENAIAERDLLVKCMWDYETMEAYPACEVVPDDG